MSCWDRGLLRAFQSSHLTFGPRSRGGAAETNLSLLNCFLMSCWKVIVTRFCGRRNQANKLTFSTSSSVPCVSLLAPHSIYGGHAAGICAQALEGGWQQHKLPLFLLCKEGILERQVVPGHTVSDKALVLPLLGRKNVPQPGLPLAMSRQDRSCANSCLLSHTPISGICQEMSNVLI